MGLETLLVLGTVAAGIGALGTGVAAVSGAFGGDDKSGSDEVDPALTSGALSEEASKELARKRMFRSGTAFTSPTGLTGESTVASAKIK